MNACELCAREGGEILFASSRLRVIAVDDPLHPGFCRVIWHAHVREMSDLAPADRAYLMEVVVATESALRAVLAPTKINLASLGNLTPHLHWHVIARFAEDPHFPAPVWATPRHGRSVALPLEWRAAVRTWLRKLPDTGVD